MQQGHLREATPKREWDSLRNSGLLESIPQEVGHPLPATARPLKPWPCVEQVVGNTDVPAPHTGASTKRGFNVEFTSPVAATTCMTRQSLTRHSHRPLRLRAGPGAWRRQPRPGENTIPALAHPCGRGTRAGHSAALRTARLVWCCFGVRGPQPGSFGAADQLP